MSIEDHIREGQRRGVTTAVGVLLLMMARLAFAAAEVQTPTEWWIGLLKDIGFPICVAAFLLIRVERTLSEIKNALIDLRISIREHTALRDGER